MKIRIIGPCGSGKSTVARALSRQLGIAYHEIDNLMWDRSVPNVRHPEPIRDRMFQDILESEDWILEGVQHGWTMESFRQADWVLVLHPHVLVRDYRIIRRFLRSRTGLEQWNYKQTFSNLVKMVVEWNHGYDPDKILRLTAEFADKRIVAAGQKELAAWADCVTREKAHAEDCVTREKAHAEGASMEQRGA
jgi:adenylate kinase family enzyme